MLLTSYMMRYLGNVFWIKNFSNWTILQKQYDWLMPLNINKCKVTYFGNSRTADMKMMYLETSYMLSLEASVCERDLGVYIPSNIRWTDHINIYRIYDCIESKQNIEDVEKNIPVCRVEEIVVNISILEFASALWNL